MAISSVIATDTDVRAFIDEYFKAWEGTDENRILSYYAENVSLEIPGTLINGKAALRDQFVRPVDVTTLLRQISSHQPQVLQNLLISWFASRTYPKAPTAA